MKMWYCVPPNMSQIESYHEVAIPHVLVKFGRNKVLSCQFGALCLSLQPSLINPDVKYESHLQTYYCNSLTPLPLQDGQSSFIDRRTCQFSNFQLCSFSHLSSVRYCNQVFPHWAGPMFRWRVKNIMRNDIHASWAPGFINSAVQTPSLWWHMTRIIPSNMM
jgi:hypothetical protein